MSSSRRLGILPLSPPNLTRRRLATGRQLSHRPANLPFSRRQPASQACAHPA
jgi:hypothetical protein